MITQEELKRLLDYSPLTGVFVWKENACQSVRRGDVAGHITDKGYVVIRLKYKLYKAHRLAWLYVFGYMPLKLDHENGIKSNNAISNLRQATTAQNNQNARTRKDNKSGIKGVSFHKASGKWIAQISVNGKRFHIGLFGDIDSAAAKMAYVREQSHGEFARHA